MKQIIPQLTEIIKNLNAININNPGDIGELSLYYTKDEVETLLDSHEPRVNTADLAFDQKSKTLYVPSFYNKTITAYQLK